MNGYQGMKCIRCGKSLGENSLYEGCPSCGNEGYNVNYTATYDYSRIERWPPVGKNMWRYRELFPIADNVMPVTLEEGNTPLIHLQKIGPKLGLENLYLKDESRNPTWSYKDRLCSLIVTRAVQDGAKVITVASTGNHGASIAAYAAKAGIPCVVFTVPQVPQVMKTLMQSYGAYVLATPTGRGRWKIMEYCVKNLGWMPASGYVAPPIGSNSYGIEGYKTIAYELIEQLQVVPDYVVMPACYSDGLYGVWKGMKDLKEMGVVDSRPHMIASEAFGSLKETLQKRADKPIVVPSEATVSFSIATGVGTYQGLTALKESDGLAETSNDLETIEMQKELATIEGLYAESSSVTTLVAVSKLRKRGILKGDDKVVIVMTSSGLKEQGSTIPVILPEVNDLRKTLKNTFGFQM
jgi:threonine synthase